MAKGKVWFFSYWLACLRPIEWGGVLKIVITCHSSDTKERQGYDKWYKPCEKFHGNAEIYGNKKTWNFQQIYYISYIIPDMCDAIFQVLKVNYFKVPHNIKVKYF